ncbi:MAG: phosphoenolpyruvate--protein phosphotransferase [Hydrogenophilales bacterium 16-64-46]|nr:MAG: phosphoenolpyruvate--protein phosphotransferase [Hydrogenophilales bacterium 12-64-13]OYZ07048.1 MAG: phosphoenolpyruvate--protein phosphotransferase [Hydrogenophilales bacterium 16-64-46]OZA37756.1 MAG: phosphoenolpyruvate--protein phosphotransferase [Hydrogenophilales bacterium 17-64-34]HQS99293.1 phosphoenolpyruvate--protein phosphotransferase [Thiobacillus sp.]
MSFSLHGIGVSGGIAIGYAHLTSNARVEVPQYMLDKQYIDEELARFDEAILATRSELETLRDHIPANAPAELSAFLDMHLMFLGDSMIAEEPKRLIRETQCNAEWALAQQMEALVARFEEIDDAYLRSRQEDVVQVVQRVLKSLMGHPSHLPLDVDFDSERILVAHELSPADMVIFKNVHFAAFVTDLGGATSHTAILARSMAMPSVMAMHNARGLIRDHDLLIVDGRDGVVLVNPDEAVLAEYRLRQNQWRIDTDKLQRLKSSKSATLDGTTVELMANIELVSDIDAVKAAGAHGVGLFRSEFLFLNRADLPTEDEQYEAYKAVAEALDGKPVTIRTLDLGADKQAPWGHTVADNPALGLRAIRLCLVEPGLFHTQLRAILRASKHGRVRILVPMLANFVELRQTLQRIDEAKDSLRRDGLKFDDGIPVGGMIEVPAAALSATFFAEQLDFLSIGTNDLIQYTLAIDRADDSVAHLYDPLHPAVLGLIQQTLRAGAKAGKPVSVCGEMAGDPLLTRLLLGLGLRSFSMQPASLLQVKQQVLRSHLDEISPIAQKLLKNTDPEKTAALLGRLNG